MRDYDLTTQGLYLQNAILCLHNKGQGYERGIEGGHEKEKERILPGEIDHKIFILFV